MRQELLQLDGEPSVRFTPDFRDRVLDALSSAGVAEQMDVE